MAIATLGEGEDQGFARLDFDDDAWAPAQVPRLHGATSGNEAIWYRLRFARPRHRQRTLVRFDGAFLVANVWLNGRLLGSHYGYIAPFTFDISSFLLEENVLAVCIEAPVETDLAAKRHLTGIFGDSDIKPYPSRELGALSEQFAWHVPMGLWQPVWLEQVGHVVAEWMHCEPRLEQGDLARIKLRTRLRNLDGRIMTGELAIRLAADNFEGGAQLEMRRAFRLNGHEVQDVLVELALPNPQLWYPWAHGEPALYQAQVQVSADERPSASLKETFGIRDVSLETRAEGWTLAVNGRRIFIRGAGYCSEFFLDAAGDELLKADLELARQASMDMLRLTAHVEPPGFYQLADRSGLLVWQELPLTGSYVHRADARSMAFFREAVLAQAEELVHLLFNHPSVLLYAVHDDPPWNRALAWLGERHTEQLNRDVDEEAAALLRELDGSRPVMASSGDQDVHCDIGWSQGHWRELGQLSPGFVSEVGAQALPNANSPVWRHLNRGWPVADDDQSWRYAGYQPREFVDAIGAPSSHPSRDGCIRVSQEYQAHLLGFAIDRWRREHEWTDLYPLSALTGENVPGFLDALVGHLPEGAPLFPSEVWTDVPERELCAELIREQILRQTEQEVPYSAAVLVEEFDESEREVGPRGLVRISATVLVERDSQKAILIGKGGSRLKAIGTKARGQIEKLLGCKVFLQLHVRVEKDWTQSARGLRRAGYHEG